MGIIIVLDKESPHVANFIKVWGKGMQVGWADGSGLGGSGDAVFVFNSNLKVGTVKNNVKSQLIATLKYPDPSKRSKKGHSETFTPHGYSAVDKKFGKSSAWVVKKSGFADHTGSPGKYCDGSKTKDEKVRCKADGDKKCGLFIAEVAEGSSYNKYLEIYNPTEKTVNLKDYAFPNSANGAKGKYEYWNTFSMGKKDTDTADKRFGGTVKSMASTLISAGFPKAVVAKMTKCAHAKTNGVTDMCTNSATKGLTASLCPCACGGKNCVTSAATCEWIVEKKNFWDKAGFHKC